MMWRDYFVFSKSDRRALIVLLAIILVLTFLLSRKHGQPHGDVTTAIVADPDSTASTAEAIFDPVAFNPNTADSATLRAVGLTPFVASNIVKYRKAGGHFRKPDDLRRIYGMDDEMFERMKPYIYIPAEEPPRRPSYPKGERRHEAYPKPDSMLLTAGGATQERQESPYKEYMENKLHEGQFIDLNRADSADLVRIPGIGPYYARRIVNLRKQLGGYVSVAQLADIENIPDIGDWVTIQPDGQQRLNVNTATLKQLRDHPYIGYYRARAIVDLREREGRVVNLRQLSFLPEFSEADIQRLEPYLSF